MPVVSAGQIALNLNFTSDVIASPAGKYQPDFANDTPYPDPNDPEGILKAADCTFFLRNIGGVNPQTGTTYTVAESDMGKLVTLSNGSAIAVTLPITLSTTFLCAMQNLGAGTATLTPASSHTINGAASLTLKTGEGVWLFFDGTNWFAVCGRTALNFADNEVVGGTFNGSNTAGTLAHTPNPTGSLQLVVDLGVLTVGATEDFTLSGTSITFATAPRSGANVRAWYRY